MYVTVNIVIQEIGNMTENQSIERANQQISFFSLLYTSLCSTWCQLWENYKCINRKFTFSKFLLFQLFISSFICTFNFDVQYIWYILYEFIWRYDGYNKLFIFSCNSVMQVLKYHMIHKKQTKQNNIDKYYTNGTSHITF